MVRMRFGPNGRWRGRMGYTLIELLVVMAIILILVGMVANGLAGMTRSRRVKNSTASVLNVIHMARSRAISDNTVTHVRVENRGPNDQWISIYRFPKAADAILAKTEAKVATLGTDPSHRGWNPLGDPNNGYCNYRMEGQKLQASCWFVTDYTKSSIWNPTLNRIIVGAPSTGNAPKREISPGTYEDALLYFYPDGTACGNLLFYIRDETHLMWVRVHRGGEVKSGDITNWADFDHVN